MPLGTLSPILVMSHVNLINLVQCKSPSGRMLARICTGAPACIPALLVCSLQAPQLLMLSEVASSVQCAMISLLIAQEPDQAHSQMHDHGVTHTGCGFLQVGVDASPEDVLDHLIKLDTATAFNTSERDVVVSSVTQLSRRVLYVNVTATLGVDVPPGASSDDVTEALDLKNLSADGAIGLLLDDPDKFLGRTTKVQLLMMLSACCAGLVMISVTVLYGFHLWRCM